MTHDTWKMELKCEESDIKFRLVEEKKGETEKKGENKKRKEERKEIGGKICDTPKPGGPIDYRQPAETCVSHIMRPIHE